MPGANCCFKSTAVLCWEGYSVPQEPLLSFTLMPLREMQLLVLVNRYFLVLLVI